MATYTNLDDEIFAQSALEGYVATLVPFGSFSTNFGPMPVQKGDNVLVPLIGALTATTFGGSYAICGGTQSVITVSINRHKHVPIGQTDLTAAASSRANLQSFGFQQGAALAIAVLQDVFTLLTTGNFGNASSVSVASFGMAELRKGRLLLNQAKAPMMPRAAVLDAVPFDSLLAVTNFIQAYAYGDSVAVREGRIPKVIGLDMFETNGLPGTNSVMGFVAHASAIAVAMRYLMPQDGHRYIEARPVTDPETGATFGIRRHYDENTGTLYTNLEANYGYSVGISNGARLYHRTD